MRADEDVDVAREQPFVYLFAFAFACRAGEQFDADADAFAHFAERLIVLCGKDFGRRHQACLEAVVDSHQCRHQRHDGLSAADVALQQSVHLTSAAHVGAYLFEHALLRPGQGERQHVEVEVVEVFADAAEHVATTLGVARARVAQYVELDVEKFFKLQPEAALLHLLNVRGHVHCRQGVVEPYEPARVDD